MSKFFNKVSSKGLQQVYDVVLPVEAIEAEMDISAKEYAKSYKLAGFRPGHVPLSIVKTKLKKKITNDALDNLISKTYKDILKEANVKEFATKPTYKLDAPFEEGKAVSLKMTIESAPEFELKPYDFEITKIVPKVNQVEIEERRKLIMESNPVYEGADKNHVVEISDKVLYAVQANKQEVKNVIIIPENADNDKIAKQFLGQKLKQNFDLEIDNKKYTVTILSIQKQIQGISASDYATKIGFKDLEALDKSIENQIKNEIESRAHLYYKSQIIEALTKEYNFELPESIVEQETKVILYQIRQEEKASGNSENKTDEQLIEEYGETIKQRVMLGYIFNKIAVKERIVATDNELNSIISNEINANPLNAERIIKYYQQNPGALAYKRAEITEHKVISFLVSHARTKEEEKTLPEVIELIDKLLEDDDETTDVKNKSDIK